MTNAEAVPEFILKPLQHRVHIRPTSTDKISRKSGLRRAQPPDVQIMHFVDATGSLQMPANSLLIDAGRYGIHRQSDGITKQPPGAHDDDEADRRIKP